MARRATLRAADADREHVAECLRKATAEGRLSPHELEERLEATFSARSYGELDAVVADLPRPPARPRRPTVGWMVLAAGLGLAVAIPLLLVILAAVLFVVLPVAATLAFWLGICWWFFGHRRPARRRVYGGRGRLYITRF